MKKLALILLLVVIGLTACEKSNLEPTDPTINDGAISLPLNLSVQSMSAGTSEAKAESSSYSVTKSAIGENEPLTTIQNLWIVQFSTTDGRVVGEPQYIEDYQTALSTNKNIASLVPSGDEEHTLVYIANSFNAALTAPIGTSFTIDEFKSLTYDITDEQSNFKKDNAEKYYAVLYGEKTQKISSSGLEECTLIRNVAKINIKIDVTSGVDLNFTEAVIRGVPAISSYFPNVVADENYPADDSFMYTNYEGEEITDQTKTLTFYVPVNMRGKSVSTTGAMKNHYGTPYCTSISLVADVDGKGYLYTFFLGSNLENDYNLAANTEYTYTLTFNTVGDPDSDLRIEEAGGVDFSLPTMPRSNCYILNPSGAIDCEYIIPIDRIDDFWGNPRYNTANVPNNTLDKVGTNWEAVILWHDHKGDQQYDAATDQIGGFKLEADKSNNTVKVTLPKEFAISSNHCNVVFIVRKTAEYDTDGEQDILWSWHLWITDYDPYPDNLIPSLNVFQYAVPGGELHRYNNTPFTTGVYGQKLIMDRNIGARSATEDGYGLSGTTFTSPGTLHYQYGRFSPYPAQGYTYCNSYAQTTYPASGTGQVSFAESVQMPNAHIKYSGNWCNEKDGETTEYIWNDYTINSLSYKKGKSIFDPSPMGFCVPINGTWAGFTSGSAMSEFENPNSYTFKLVNNIDGVSTAAYNRIYNGYAYFPASGYRINSSGGFYSVGSNGYCWSASPSSEALGFFLYFGSTGVGTSNSYNRANGFTVRPIQE